MAKTRIDKGEDVLKLGDTVKVKYMGVDNKGRMNFSIKDAE
jgi:predicted RNA-binding protein with RPS1 domain